MDSPYLYNIGMCCVISLVFFLFNGLLMRWVFNGEINKQKKVRGYASGAQDALAQYKANKMSWERAANLIMILDPGLAEEVFPELLLSHLKKSISNYPEFIGKLSTYNTIVKSNKYSTKELERVKLNMFTEEERRNLDMIFEDCSESVRNGLLKGGV